jgi:hypothetical protein
MITQANAQLAVWKGIVHLCSGYDPIRCIYEYTKNFQDAGAKSVFLEFYPQRKIITIYGDGCGMDDKKLTEVMNNIGESLKSKENHGLGMQCWPRIATRMTIFSRVDGVLYTVSCSRHDNARDMYLHGGARPVDGTDLDYKEFYNKLNKGDFKTKDSTTYVNGTVTVLEGIGNGSDEHYDFFKFKMKDELNASDVIEYFRNEHSRSFLTACRFSVKKDEDSHLIAVEPKIGIGKKVEFTIPSKKYPEKDIPGKSDIPKNCFYRNGHLYELIVDFIFHFGASNEAKITVTHNGKDPVSINSIRTNAISRDGVYRNPEYTKFINGNIDIHIKPLDGGNIFTIHDADRSSIIIGGEDFGRCFTNILLFADLEVLRPEVEQQLSKVTEKTSKRSEVVQKTMENICDRYRDFLDQFISTKSNGPVHDATVKCIHCLTCGIPRRNGETLKQIRTHLEAGVIYAPVDATLYVCGSCSTQWVRRTYTPSNRERTSSPSTPHYTQPSYGDGRLRQKQKGYGYSYSVHDFSAGDTQTAMLKGEDMICINSAHINYKTVKSSGDLLCIYEAQNAFHVLLTSEFKKAADHLSVEEQQNILKQMDNKILVWIQTTDRKKLKSISDMSAPMTTNTTVLKHTPTMEKPKANVSKDIKALGDRWGARIKA